MLRYPTDFRELNFSAVERIRVNSGPGPPHPKYVQHLLGHASIRLTLDRYSHWMPSMGRNTAEGIDEALG